MNVKYGMANISIGIGLILSTMFVSWICEIIASYYSVGSGKFMEYLRAMIALLILMEILYLTLPTDRTTFL